MFISHVLKDQINGLSPGAVFCANDFADLGDRGTIDVNLHRLAKSSFIRRLGFGLYDKPCKSPLLGDLSPDISDVVKAYARRTGQTITLDPAGAANTLGLTTQVPAKITFLTDGKSHTIQICGVDIKLVHASPKKLAGANYSVGIIIQALRYFGTKMAPDNILQTLSKNLSDQDIKILDALKNKTLLSITPQIDRIIKYATIH